MLCLHGFGRALVGDHGGGLVVIDVAAGLHGDITARATHNDDVVHGILTEPRDRGIHIGLQRDLAAAAQTLVGGDDELRGTAFDTAGQGIWRETAEHDGVDRAEPGAGQHGVCGLRDHRQVERDPVTLTDTAIAQHIGHAADFRMKLPIGDVLGFVGVVAFPNDRYLVAARREVTVDAIVGDVGLAVLEPFDRDVAGSKACILDGRIRRRPIDPLAVFTPKCSRVIDRGLVHRLIPGVVYMRTVDPGRADVDHLLVHDVFPTGARSYRENRAAGTSNSFLGAGTVLSQARRGRMHLRPHPQFGQYSRSMIGRLSVAADTDSLDPRTFGLALLAGLIGG